MSVSLLAESSIKLQFSSHHISSPGRKPLEGEIHIQWPLSMVIAVSWTAVVITFQLHLFPMRKWGLNYFSWVESETNSCFSFFRPCPLWSQIMLKNYVFNIVPANMVLWFCNSMQNFRNHLFISAAFLHIDLCVMWLWKCVTISVRGLQMV